MELSYILKLRNALKPEYRHMPIFQSGSAIIVENENKETILDLTPEIKTGMLTVDEKCRYFLIL